MAIIGLEEIELYGYHGFYEEERRIGCRYQVDIEVSVDLDTAEWEDNISETVNYESLYAICEEEMKTQQKLIETLALRMAKRVKALSTKVALVHVEVRKLNPPIYGQIGSAVVKVNL